MLLAFTRPVPRSITECELTHLDRQPVDYRRAASQHDAYEAALRALGCVVERLPGQDDHPDSVFIEDAAVVLDECAVMTRPGASSRRGEVAIVADALRPHRRLFTIESPGTLDGGDVLRVGRRIYVGRSARTNTDGARQLADVLEPLGYALTSVPVTRCLHLKTAVTALDDDRVLVNPGLIDTSSFGAVSCVSVDAAEPMAANVVSVGRAVLCAASAPHTARRIEREGFEVVPVDASELAKAEGGLTCCSLLFQVPDTATV